MKNEITQSKPANTGISVFDTDQFSQMWTIAGALSQSTLVPLTLQGKTIQETQANCLRVVEQASRWGLSPFAVMDCASVVHGKLMWEGKLIAAAIQALLGVRLTYEYSGQGEQRKVVVTGILDDIKMSIEGTVSDWKTSGSNSPWEKLANRDQMLAYRGARQWARRYAPEVILGVYAQDEFEDLEPRNVSPSKTLARLETPNIPGRKPAPADAIPATYEAAAEVVAPSDPVTILPTGKQTLVRHERDAKLKSVTEKTSDKGLRYFEVATAIAGKSIVLTTFSTTDGEALQQLDPGAMIRAVVVKSGDLLTLEAFTMIANEEGLV